MSKHRHHHDRCPKKDKDIVKRLLKTCCPEEEKESCCCCKCECKCKCEEKKRPSRCYEEKKEPSCSSYDCDDRICGCSCGCARISMCGCSCGDRKEREYISYRKM